MNLVGDKYVGGSGPDSVNIVRTYDAGTYCFNYEYTPYRGGLFQLNVTYSSDYDATPVHVAGSPFLVRVSSDLVTDGSTSLVVGRDVSLPINEYEAGRYYNFTIIARDSTGIFRLVGGDLFEVRRSYLNFTISLILFHGMRYPLYHDTSTLLVLVIVLVIVLILFEGRLFCI